MIGGKTSRVLTPLGRRSLQQPQRLPSRSRALNFRCYSVCSTSALTSSSLMDGARRNRYERIYQIPRISLPSYYHFSSATDSDEEAKQSTLRERMHERREKGRAAAKKGALKAGDLLKTYGPVFIGTYLGVYLSTLGVLYLGVETGVLDPANLLSLVTSNEDSVKSTAEIITEFLDHYPWTKPYSPVVARNPQMANFAVAWIATKFTEPIRFGVTVAIVPKLARTLGYVTPKADTDGTNANDEKTNKESEK